MKNKRNHSILTVQIIYSSSQITIFHNSIHFQQRVWCLPSRVIYFRRSGMNSVFFKCSGLILSQSFLKAFFTSLLKFSEFHHIDIDIFVNCNWVDTRWQYTLDHLLPQGCVSFRLSANVDAPSIASVFPENISN
jgi:hypothetical protein